MSNTIKYCSLCGRSEDVTGKQVEMSGLFNVCPDCMQKTMDTMKNFNSMDALKMMGGFSQTPENDLKDEHQPENTDNTEENGEKKQENKEEETGFPNIKFLNLGDISSLMRPQSQIKNSKKKKKAEPQPILSMDDIPKPHEIKAMLDEYVVGQSQAKKIISVGVYNHYKRIFAEKDAEVANLELEEVKPADAVLELSDNTQIEKSNMLMLGPTGSGKTYLVKTLARLLRVPLAITDATSLTEAGYIGDDIESVVSKLLAEADNDVERAEQGIIFIDEIDKIAKKKNSHARDVSGESVQQGMLKLIEGADVEVPVGASSKNAMVPMATINTRNILFICGGAFPDIDEIIKKRLTKKSSIGYSATLKDAFDNEKNIQSQVTAEDLREFGMIPEFIGRLPIVFALDGQNEDMLIQILKEPKNAILKQYKKLLDLDEVKLEFEDEALRVIAQKALEKDTGARALRAIIEEFMLDIMYEVPKDKNIGMVTITEDYVLGKGSPRITMRG